MLSWGRAHQGSSSESPDPPKFPPFLGWVALLMGVGASLLP